MDPEQRFAQLEDRIEELLEMVEDNNRRLRSINRSLRWSFWGRLIIWVIVLALPFIVLGPLLKTLVPGLPGSGSNGVVGLPSAQQLQSLLNAYKAGSGTASSTPQ